MDFLYLTLRFYSKFVPATGLITVAGLIICSQTTSLSFAIAFTIVKLVTNTLIGGLVHLYTRADLFYYNNLGIPSSWLYASALVWDMTIWISMLIIMRSL